MGQRRKGERQEPRFGLGPSLDEVRPTRPAADDDLRYKSANASRDIASRDTASDMAKKRSRRDDDDDAPRQRGRGRKSSERRRRFGLGRAVYWGVVLSLWLVIAGVGGVIWVGMHLPPIHSLEIPKRPPTVRITGIDGSILATRGEQAGTNVALGELPPYLPNAFLAIEDRRFYSHFGIDPFGVARALTANILHRGVSQGGSTITQQLAKNLFLTQERTMWRKLQEAELALWLERKYSKKQILELYLNRVYFGSGAYGVEAAAQKYFGKSARKVTLNEAAMLAGLVKSPSRLAPNRNPEGAEQRADLVLAAMADMGVITQAQAKAAESNPAVAVAPAGAGTINYVADWIIEVLDDLVGQLDGDVLVETTIDPRLQAVAEAAIIDELAAKSVKFQVTQGALVAMTPQGAVRAMVGGRNYADSQFNRAVSAKRQPGSAFKPFVYLTALEHGLTPETVRQDAPLDIKGWRPENYSKEYFGNVTLTQALAHSLNTVAVRLGLAVTPKAVVRTAHRLGIASKLEPNASIALGTSEVSVVELVGAYATFANNGAAVAPYVVERIRNEAGKTLYKRNPEGLGQVVDRRHVGMMNMMMQETLLTGTARKAEIPGWPAAGKTGTSQDFRDAWFIGYTGHLVTGVWLGNDDNSPTRKTTGGGLPVEVWTRFMRVAHQNVPVVDLPIDRGGGLFGFGRTPMANAQSPNAQPVQQVPNAPIPASAPGYQGAPYPSAQYPSAPQTRGQSNGGVRQLEPMGGIDSFMRGIFGGR